LTWARERSARLVVIRYSQVRTDERPSNFSNEAPRPQVRRLNQVLGLLSRAQHPRAMSQQLTPPSATDESLADCHRLRPNWWREPSDALASHI
jgi:hypothetical protein